MYADALGLLVFGASLTSGSLSKKIFDRLKVTVGIAYRDFFDGVISIFRCNGQFRAG